MSHLKKTFQDHLQRRFPGPLRGVLRRRHRPQQRVRLLHAGGGPEEGLGVHGGHGQEGGEDRGHPQSGGVVGEARGAFLKQENIFSMINE